MTSTFRLAGAAALCAALLLSACAKKTDQTTTTSTDTTQAGAASTAPDASASTAPDASSSAAPGTSASSSPDATASTAPDATATTSAVTTTVSNATGSDAFIKLPIYPGATEAKDGSISTTTNNGSVDVKSYMSKDDSKKVSDWYKGHLPSSFQSMVMTAEGKTVGTFADEHKNGDGDQAVLITVDGSTSQTRIQLSTKHGK